LIADVREVNLGEFEAMWGENNCKKDKNLRWGVVGGVLRMKGVHLSCLA
jgi:hypothetical protein